MANENPFARAENLVLDDMRSLRQKARKSTVPVSGTSHDMRRKPRTRMEQFRAQHDIRSGDLFRIR